MKAIYETSQFRKDIKKLQKQGKDIGKLKDVVKQIANDHGIAWAPAWIVKDQKRVTKRGMYSVPELAAYCDAINEDALESDHVTIVEDVPAADDMLDVVAECCEDVVDVIKVELTDWAITA